jgi:hypothetical protein
MIVYNITVKVDRAIAPKWLDWLREREAPEILATGCFYKYHILHLPELEDDEGPTYAVQYYAHTAAGYETYMMRFAARFRQQAAETWGSRLVSFGTLMHVVA